MASVLGLSLSVEVQIVSSHSKCVYLCVILVRVQNNYYGGGMMAPPLMGGFGYGGFMPSFFFPIGFGGGFIQLFITLFIISAVVNAVQGFSNKKEDDDFDNFK